MIEFHEDLHQYVVDGIPYVSVTQVLKDMGMYGNAASFFTDEARDRGTFAHQAIEWHLKNELDEDSLDPTIRPYFDAFKRFEADTGFVPDEIEKALASDLYLLAGRPDLIGKINGCMSVIDIKTSSVVHPAERLQTAAYEFLYGKPLKRFSLHLGNNGKYKLTEFKERQDRHFFLSCLSVYQWKKGNLK